MSAELVNTADGFLALKIAGKLMQPKLGCRQKHALENFQQQGKMSILILTEA